MELCLVFRPLAGSLAHFLGFQLLFLFCFVFLKSVPGVGSEEGQRLASFVLCGHRSPASRSSSEILTAHVLRTGSTGDLNHMGFIWIIAPRVTVCLALSLFCIGLAGGGGAVFLALQQDTQYSSSSSPVLWIHWLERLVLCAFYFAYFSFSLFCF